MKLIPKVLGNFTKEFLSGVWKGMGPDITKRRNNAKSSGRVSGRKGRKVK